jgi:hypothetical protein
MSRMPAAAIALALAAPAIPLAQGQGMGDGPDRTSIDRLKSEYLACNVAVMKSRLEAGAIMQCSVVYEALLQRGFGGDFIKLLAWSKAHTPQRVAAGATRPQQAGPDGGP